jgi:hypothetical protein
LPDLWGSRSRRRSSPAPRVLSPLRCCWVQLIGG